MSSALKNDPPDKQGSNALYLHSWVQSLPRPTTVMISTHFHRTRLQTFLKLVAVSSVYMLQDVRCLDEKPMHFGISIHLQLGGARRKSGETTSPQTKYNSFKYPKT